MKSKSNLIILIFLLTIIFPGCKSPIVTPYWEENENRFNTNDLARAQKEIPFTIILPTYFPEDSRKKIPDIEGPLSQFQQDDKIEVRIMYDLYPGDNLSGIIIIDETNYASSLGDPELNPELERKIIEGISVVKTKDDWSPGRDAYYSFNSKDIYYNVETHGITNEESFKIVESMIKQIK